MLKWPVLYHIFKTIPNEWTWNFVVPRHCRKSKLVSWIFFADSQEFILSCVMQSSWNKSLNENIVYCVQYLEKEAKVLKFVLTCRDIKPDHYTIDRDLHGICGHSWCLMQLLATSTVVQFPTNQLMLSKLITTVKLCTLISDTWRVTNFSFEFSLTV